MAEQRTRDSTYTDKPEPRRDSPVPADAMTLWDNVLDRLCLAGSRLPRVIAAVAYTVAVIYYAGAVNDWLGSPANAQEWVLWIAVVSVPGVLWVAFDTWFRRRRAAQTG